MKAQTLADRLLIREGKQQTIVPVAGGSLFIESVVELQPGTLVCLVMSICGSGYNYDHLALVVGNTVTKLAINRTDTSKADERLEIFSIDVRKLPDESVLICKYGVFLPGGMGGIHAIGVVDLVNRCIVCEQVTDRFSKEKSLAYIRSMMKNDAGDPTSLPPG